MGILSLFRRQKPKAEPAAEPAAPQEQPAPVQAPGRPQAVLVEPVVTEKSALLTSKGQYVFWVAGGATKQQVRRAVEVQYRVHVTKVRVVNLPGKVRRRGQIEGTVPGGRKAIVSVRSGEKIQPTGELR